MEEKLQELLQSEEFAKKLAECPDKNKVQELFASEDVELSMEEIDALGKAIKQAIKKAKSEEDDGELTEDDLEDVAGGAVSSAVFFGILVVACLSYAIYEIGDRNGWWD